MTEAGTKPPFEGRAQSSEQPGNARGSQAFAVGAQILSHPFPYEGLGSVLWLSGCGSCSETGKPVSAAGRLPVTFAFSPLSVGDLGQIARLLPGPAQSCQVGVAVREVRHVSAQGSA